jgi:tight adherence protein B
MTDAALLACGCAAAAGACAVRGGGRALLTGRTLSVGSRERRSRRLPRPGVDASALAVGGVLVSGPEAVVLGLTASLLAYVALRLWRRRRHRFLAAARRREVVEVCDALSAELAAGQPPARAVQRVAAGHHVLAPVARAATLGADVPRALTDAAAAPGAAGLGTIATAWRVAERSGAGLARVLARVASALRSDEAAAAEVEASLGPSRATARLLALLPVFGLLLGAALGGDPVAFLLGSLPGQLCLGAGAVLAATGLWWVEHLADSVERRSR